MVSVLCVEFRIINDAVVVCLHITAIKYQFGPILLCLLPYHEDILVVSSM